MKIFKILEKINELDITIGEMMTITIINDLGSLFETDLIILGKKARDENKLLDL